MPADRQGVRRFLGRFSDQELEVGLEAMTGWRFVVEELRRVGARVHLAEPAQTSALRGRKKRPKTDRADARHLRELLMIGRLPECWIAPDHLLDLRARVRLRHAIVNERGEWQQRIRAVLYHHGIPHRSELDLMRRAGREWLAGTATARHRARAGHDRARAHRRARRQAAGDRPRAARLRTPPAGMPGAASPLRDRPADGGRDPRRAR